MSTYVKLPEDAIEEILLRLPIKSLQRFKCVSISWYARITDPSFKFKHFITSRNHEFNDFLLINQLHSTKKQMLSLLSSEPLETRTKYFQISYPANPFHETLILARILGQCNGVVCIAYPPTGTISLWNPANQQLIKTIPKSHIEPPPNIDFAKQIVGFGFDNASNDYKVLVYKHWWSPSSSEIPTRACAELYTLSTNTWKEIGVGEEFQPIDCRPYPPSTPSVNGVFSWFVFDEHSEDMILSFNMKTEVFIKTRPPNHTGRGLLTSHKDSLVIIIDRQPLSVMNIYYDVWMLGEYGVRESWVKQLTIGPIVGLKGVMGFWKNGELLIEDCERNRQLMSYDPVTQNMKDLQVPDVFIYGKVIPYKKSLVCFTEDDDQEENPLSVIEYQEEELI